MLLAPGPHTESEYKPGPTTIEGRLEEAPNSAASVHDDVNENDTGCAIYGPSLRAVRVSKHVQAAICVEQGHAIGAGAWWCAFTDMIYIRRSTIIL